MAGGGTARCRNQDVSLYDYYSQCRLCTCWHYDEKGDQIEVWSVPAFHCELFTKVGFYAACDRPNCGTGGVGPCSVPNPDYAFCPDECYLVPPLGWLLWVEVYPNEPQLNWELKTSGWNEITRQVTGSDTIEWYGKFFKLYFHPAEATMYGDRVVDMNMNHFGEWRSSLPCAVCEPFNNLLVFRAGEGWMAPTAVQKSFTLYLMPYHEAWMLRSDTSCEAYSDGTNLRCWPPRCCYWGFRDGWDWTPRFAAGLQVRIATLPVEADAALDNRPVCEDLSLPLTNPRFGRYTYMGGLFVGQVRHWYLANNSRQQDDDARQTTPDLSGTGRTLLRFYSPTPLPSQPVYSAALVLYYTATPYFVHYYNSQQADAFGAVMLRKEGEGADAVNLWNEATIRWDWLNHFGLATERVSNFHLVIPDENNRWCLLQEPYERSLVSMECGWTNKQLKSRSSGVDIPTKFVSVGLAGNNLSLLSFTPTGQSGSYLNLLVTRANEEQGSALHFPDSDGPLAWYYFLSKDHQLAQDARLLPRLWLLWMQQ